MSESEKPLHVRVAEALGWTYIQPVRGYPTSLNVPTGADGRAIAYYGAPPKPEPQYTAIGPIPFFDTSWEAIGPLIEKYKLSLISWPEAEKRGVTAIAGYYLDPGFCEEPGGPEWDHEADGPTPLIAICELILKLAESGKLATEEK